MTITSVLGSGLCAQPARNKTTETQRHREKLDLRCPNCHSFCSGPSFFVLHLFLTSGLSSLCLRVSLVNDLWNFSVPSVFSVVKRNLRIADLAQDRRALGAGRGWNV